MEGNKYREGVVEKCVGGLREVGISLRWGREIEMQNGKGLLSQIAEKSVSGFRAGKSRLETIFRTLFKKQYRLKSNFWSTLHYLIL
jgi:hypothetical protein